MFNLKKKKKLTLHQVHELYLLLRTSLPEPEKKYLLDEIDWILDRITNETLEKVLGLLDIKGNGLQVLTLLIRRLKENGFFEYVKFVQGMKNAPR
jgi:hypothetical protein